MLRMRIEKAPLDDAANRVILDEYNRLTGARIPLNEFKHWVADNPVGKAWHALLETESGRIVGHTSVFPLRASFADTGVVPAKSEYSFLHEDFRKEKVEGFEKGGKSAFIVILDELFKHCIRQGWGPIFASTNERNQVFTRKVGLRPLEFGLWECMFLLKPSQTLRAVSNVTSKQRIGMFCASVAQKTAWSVASPLLHRGDVVCEGPIGGNGFPVDDSRLAFFQDSESLSWRYLEGQYIRLDIRDMRGSYLIAKRGSAEKFLRVCQSRLEDPRLFFEILRFLIHQAAKNGELGLRWAVYDWQPLADQLVKQMKRFGFLCARRTRILMVHNAQEKYLNSSLWAVNDSLFSFDP